MAKQELDLVIDAIEDPEAQENWDRTRQFIAEDLFTKFDGTVYELELASAVTNFKFRHSLGFVPKDVWTTSRIGAGTETFNYALFDREEIDITTTAAVTLRFVAGSFVLNR